MTPIEHVRAHAGISLAGWLLMGSPAAADVREPDNVYFGAVHVASGSLTADDGHYAVAVRLGNLELARYAMGTVPAFGDQYVVRVPMDAVGARLPGTARVNDVVDFVLTDGLTETLLTSATLPERGALTRLDLGGSDLDGDGVEQGHDNCPDVANPDQADRDGDGAGDGCDAFPDSPRGAVDSDGDGMDDAWEASHGLTVGVDDSQDDLDGDGQTNLQEFQADTDPGQPDAPTTAVPVPAWVPVWLSAALLLVGAFAARGWKRTS